MIGTLSVLVGIVALAVALWQFYVFVIYRNPQGAYDVEGGLSTFGRPSARP
ncbi:MAG: hypothetical protein WKF84_15530 [Pyrinomonadaceae bacterium]